MYTRGLATLVACCIASPAQAWSNHALCTWQALAVMPAIAQLPPVSVEALDDFLAKEASGLEQLLHDEELWARQNVPVYPVLPDALAFRAGGADASELHRRFVAAVRINPHSRLSLYLQLKPGEELAGRTRLDESDVTTLTRSETTKYNTFVSLQKGQQVAAIDVIASASDEPDYGLDVGLWSDNGTEYGRQSGFGKQPFGSPAIEFSSQAPIHLGFYHEAAIVYMAAPFLKRTFPEYRIHLWKSLAMYAMRTGHPYWGWRFGGWGVHYVQDLTQPYHARVLPGVGVMRMLWINTLDLAGAHQEKLDAITLVANRHLALENYQLHRIRAAYLDHDFDDAAMKALRDTSHDAGDIYLDNSPRQTISKQSFDESDQLDDALRHAVPDKYVSDPNYVMGESELGVDINQVIGTAPQSAQDRMTETIVPLLTNFGTHTRAFLRAIAG